MASDVIRRDCVWVDIDERVCERSSKLESVAVAEHLSQRTSQYFSILATYLSGFIFRADASRDCDDSPLQLHVSGPAAASEPVLEQFGSEQQWQRQQRRPCVPVLLVKRRSGCVQRYGNGFEYVWSVSAVVVRDGDG